MLSRFVRTTATWPAASENATMLSIPSGIDTPPHGTSWPSDRMARPPVQSAPIATTLVKLLGRSVPGPPGSPHATTVWFESRAWKWCRPAAMDWAFVKTGTLFEGSLFPNMPSRSPRP